MKYFWTKNICLVPNMYQAKSVVISFGGVGGGGGLKHVLVLEFLRSDAICEISCVSLTSKQAYIHIHTNTKVTG